MRKFLLILLVLLLAFSHCAVAAGSDNGSEGDTDTFEETESGLPGEGADDDSATLFYAKVTASKGVNMRAQEKDKAKVVSKLSWNAVVQVLEFGDEWCKVVYRSKTGYVKSIYLEEIDPPEPEPEEELFEEDADGTMRFARVNTDKGTLNMRSQAKDSARVVGKLSNNALVQVLQRGQKWSKVAYNAKSGYVMTSYLTMLQELPYQLLQPGDSSGEVKMLKDRLKDFGYLTRKQVNEKYDDDTEKALRKLELLNGMPETGIATPELQAFIFHGSVAKSKSGYTASNTDKNSGLTVSIFAWTSGYTILGGENRGSVEVIVHHVVQASGGSEPYNITVRWTNANGKGSSGEIVKNPFRFNWHPGMPPVYLAVTATDEAGNSVTAQVKVGIQNVLPDPNAID